MAKILIVDDDQTIGLMIKDILEFNGHKAFVTQRPKFTKEHIEEHDIDLVLLDKLIAGVDGIDICEDLKRDERFKDIPILMMSALHNVDQLCKDAGATDFLAKPFNMESLLEKTGEILKKHGKT